MSPKPAPHPMPRDALAAALAQPSSDAAFAHVRGQSRASPRNSSGRAGTAGLSATASTGRGNRSNAKSREGSNDRTPRLVR